MKNLLHHDGAARLAAQFQSTFAEKVTSARIIGIRAAIPWGFDQLIWGYNGDLMEIYLGLSGI